jgi:hypothetical protein
MKNILGLFLVMMMLSALVAQEERADAVYEKIVKTYTLDREGNTSYRLQKIQKLNTHVAFNRLYGETFIIYNPDFQQLKINESYTIMADSTRVDTPENAFNEVLPRAAAHSDTYSHLREMVVTHTGLEVGATIHLDYTITSDKDFVPALMADEILRESSPVRELEIIAKVPAGVELYHKVFNLRTAPEVMIVGSEKVYTWRFMGLPGAPHESFAGDMPLVPCLIFSSESSFANLLDHITAQPAFDYKINDAMQQFVDETKDPENEIGTLLAIQEEVIKNMKTDQVPMSWNGFRVRTPEEVWQSNGGSRFEKTLLLAALLKAAGFEATPVYSIPSRFYDSGIAGANQFDDVLLMANTKGFGTIYLSAYQTSGQSLEFQSGHKILLPLRRGQSLTELKTAAINNEILMKANLEITPEMKIEGKADIVLQGAVNPFLSLAKEPKNMAGMISGGMVVKDSAAVVVKNSNLAKTEIGLKIEKDNAFQEQLGFYRLILPEMNNGFSGWRIQYLNTERTDAFILPFPVSESYSFQIALPEGFELINKKNAINLKNRAGSVKIEISERRGVITVIRELSLTNPMIAPGDYTDFRTLVNEWLDGNNKTLVLRKAVDR